MITIDEYEFDENLYYYTGGDGHIWFLKLDDGSIKIGFDDFGQKLAGKILFVRTIPPGKERKQGQSIGTIETGKYVGALRCPLSGKVLEVNQEIEDNPGLINDDPYGKGWIIILEPTNLDEEITNDIIFGENTLREWIIKEIEEHVKQLH